MVVNDRCGSGGERLFRRRDSRSEVKSNKQEQMRAGEMLRKAKPGIRC